MATIKFGSLITDARGKINGHYFTSGQGGPTLSTNGTKLGAQVTGKKLWGYIKRNAQENSQTWQELTDDQRAAWAAAALSWPSLNRVGDTVALRGYALYMKVNGVLTSIGAARVAVPTPKQLISQVTAIEFTELTTASIKVLATVTFNPNEICVIALTPTVSNGINPSPSYYRIIQQADNVGDFPVQCINEYKLQFGAPLSGGYVWAKCYIVNTLTGQTSIPIMQKQIVS